VDVPFALLVGNDSGLHLVDQDGELVRTLSTTPASSPHELASGDILFLGPTHNVLSVLEAGASEPKAIAQLPRGVDVVGGCTASNEKPGSGGVVRVDLNRRGGLAYNPAGHLVCVLLHHRDGNAFVEVAARVRLEDGSVTCSVQARGLRDRCEGLKDPFGWYVAVPGCEHAQSHFRHIAHPPPRELTWACRGLQHDGLRMKSWSTSARWALVEGYPHELQYKQMYMYDCIDEKLYQVREGKWPEPIPDSLLPELGQSKQDTLTVSTSDPLFWLGEGDAIVIGDLLVRPGIKATKIHGDIAP
jgi:hypothetical protein